MEKTSVSSDSQDSDELSTSQNRSQGARGEELIETYVVIPPDGGYGWIVVMAAFACDFLTDGCTCTFGIFLKEIAESLDVLESQVTLSSSIQSGCYNLSGPFVCALTNRLGFRWVCIMGAILTSTSYVLASFMESLPLFVFTHGFMGGVGFGMIFLPSVIIIGFYFEKWRALATAIFVTGSAVGTMIFPPIFNILLKEYSWREKFRLLSCISMFLCFCGATYRSIKPSKIVQSNEIKSTTLPKFDMYSMVSSAAASSVLSRYHNILYPTAASIHKQRLLIGYDSSPSSSSVSIPPPSSTSASARTTKTGTSGASRMPPVTDLERMQTIIEANEDLTKCQICCMHCSRKSFCREKPRTSFRPMYRDDALFAGSVAAISQVSNRTATDKKLVDYHMSVTRAMTQKDEDEEYIPCVCCPLSVKRTLATMLDCSLFRSPSFVLLAISGFMSTLGVYLPYLYLLEATETLGNMDPYHSVYLMTVLGAANAVGRLSCGLLSFFPRMKALEMSIVSLFIAGLGTNLSTLSYDLITQVSYVTVYGLGFAVISATRPLIIVELVGLDKLTNAYGLIVLFQGFACLLGVPVAGVLLDISGDYRIPLHFAGAVIMVAAILLGVLRSIQPWEQNRAK